MQKIRNRYYKLFCRTLLFVVFIVIWYIASTLTKPMFIPSPKSTLFALGNLLESGQLVKGLLYSFTRITVAACISIGIAIPIALIVYGFKALNDLLMPIISFLRYVPVTAFSPLLILWCGIGEKMKISFLFIATFVYFLPSVLLCFDEVPSELIETGLTIGMSKWETIFEILLPASLPSICNTFLMMYGIGWTYCAIVEATNAKYGLGFIITVSSARGKTAVVFAAIIVIMVFSFIFDKIGHLIIDKIFVWKNARQEDD